MRFCIIVFSLLLLSGVYRMINVFGSDGKTQRSQRMREEKDE